MSLLAKKPKRDIMILSFRGLLTACEEINKLIFLMSAAQKKRHYKYITL
ncbi:MAG: hypothetical protein JWN37_220 [Candidatus Nomurabacteria bacterium]|nr:hypothetical protein [Candidatus Nomurabacteria bacterium]